MYHLVLNNLIRPIADSPYLFIYQYFTHFTLPMKIMVVKIMAVKIMAVKIMAIFSLIHHNFNGNIKIMVVKIIANSLQSAKFHRH